MFLTLYLLSILLYFTYLFTNMPKNTNVVGVMIAMIFGFIPIVNTLLGFMLIHTRRN